MNETNDLPANEASNQTGFPQGPLFAPVLAGLLSWAAISLGFFGLKMLMQERPEFVGPPMRATQVELVQESPQIVIRKISDDISVIKPVPPEFSKPEVIAVLNEYYDKLENKVEVKLHKAATGEK